MTTILRAALILFTVATVPAIAQPPAPAAMTIPPSGSPSRADASPSTRAFKAADQKMMRGMMVPMSGDPDQDFVAGMIPHHQGAVDMAKVELQYGKDPEMRRLATNIVNSQDKQIAQMEAWRGSHTASH